MKKYLYLFSLLFVGLSFTACEPGSDEELPVVATTLKVTMPESMQAHHPALAIESLKMTDINSGNTSAVKAVVDTTSADSTCWMLNISAREGVYTIDMEAKANYVVADSLNMSTTLRAYLEGATIRQATATTPIELKAEMTYENNEKGGFVIAEIFFTGTETPEGKQYNGDKYFRIMNNSDETLCADGLTIIESAFMTVDKNDYRPNIMDEAFTGESMYRIPLGSNRMVKPGESILICDIAIDHTAEANKNSFDLTKADYEWYDESSNPRFTDTDNPDVPNMEKIYSYTATIWGPHNRGFHSYALARLGEDAENQLAAADFLKNNFYVYSYDFVFNDMSFPMDGDGYMIPNEWILDAVNLSVESEFQWIITSPVLDKGWTYCGKVDGDKTRYGKSVRRKVVEGTKKLQDTNNSTEDFLPEQVADPYFEFFK